MSEPRLIADGFRFPEGPIAMDDGSVLFVEIQGQALTRVSPFPDLSVTNICFGGPDRRTAFVTLSGVGHLMAAEWPRPGLALNFTA